jgi:hypothetical protein
MEVHMLLSISDFFKCPDALYKLHNCGFLSSYLDSFAQWMAKQQFADFTIRSHITNVAHSSIFQAASVKDGSSADKLDRFLIP